MPSFGQDTPKAQEQWRAGVNEERSRRIIAGTVVEVPGYGPVALQGREEDRTNLTGLFNVATVRRDAGDTSAAMTFRDRDDVVHQLTPGQMIDLYVAAIAWIDAVYKASWSLKEGDVPRNYADDTYWP